MTLKDATLETLRHWQHAAVTASGEDRISVPVLLADGPTELQVYLDGALPYIAMTQTNGRVHRELLLIDAEASATDTLTVLGDATWDPENEEIRVVAMAFKDLAQSIWRLARIVERISWEAYLAVPADRE